MNKEVQLEEKKYRRVLAWREDADVQRAQAEEEALRHEMQLRLGVAAACRAPLSWPTRSASRRRGVRGGSGLGGGVAAGEEGELDCLR